MAMSRKHYRQFAAAVDTARDLFPDDREGIDNLANAFAIMAGQDNPHFNAARFHDACRKVSSR